MKKSTREQIKFWSSFFVGVTFSYFVWLTWNKLTELIGNSTMVWIITGVVVLVAIILGHFSIRVVAKRFSE